jgi:hypothetical protein
MIARAKYSDFVGTSAADLSDIDSKELAHFLKDKGVDTARYKPVGARFYTGWDYGTKFHCSIICTDEKAEHDGLIQISAELSAEDFFGLFKRVEVVFYKKFGNHSERPFREANIEDVSQA